MYRRSAMMLVAASVISSYFGVSTSAAELKVGEQAPTFKAVGIDGKEYSLEKAKGTKATVVVFTCNNCPVAVAYEDRFIDFQKKHADSEEVKFIAINVNSAEDIEAMKERAEEKGINYPYVYDGSGESALAYGAKVTPHVFVLNGEGALAYQGSFDDKQNDPSKPHVENAVKALLEGKTPEVQSTRAFGCGIRVKKK